MVFTYHFAFLFYRDNKVKHVDPFLFYRDNKVKHVDPATGKKDSKRVKEDI
jgi:hypothetical protein